MAHRLPYLLAPIAALGAVACGDDLDLSPYTIDTRDRDGATTGALVAFEGQGGWQAATETSPGVFTFTPTGQAVAFAQACATDPAQPQEGSAVSLTYTALDDNRVYVTPCYRIRTSAGRPLTSIDVAPVEARLSVGRASTFGGNDTERRLVVPPGTWDVVAATAERVLVQRGQVFPTPSPLALDVDAAGAVRQAVAFDRPAADDGETMSVEYAFITAAGTRASLGSVEVGADVRVVPASLEIAGDAHELQVFAERADRVRWAWKRGTVEQATHDLGFLDGAHDLSATWQGAPEVRWGGGTHGAALAAGFDQYSGINAHWSAWWDDAGQDAHDLRGRWTPPDLSAVAGWDPAWNLDRTAIASTDYWVEVSDGLAEVSYGSTTVRGTFSPAGRDPARDAVSLRVRRSAFAAR